MTEIPDSCTSTTGELNKISALLWGPNINEDLFLRWSQGFTFCREEPTALLQSKGGPCAVIAPMQAFILRAILLDLPPNSERKWREVDETRSKELLVSAACTILHQASCDNRYTIVHMSHDMYGKTELDNLPSIDPKAFHQHLSVTTFKSIHQVEAFYLETIEVLRDNYGVLLFLYSVMATKGLLKIEEEVNDHNEPLIDSVHGYGSQSLINLLLTGRAVGHVWDNDQDVGGLKLRGIDQQGEVGFLALLEHMRFCEVGSYLKNPKQAIWVLASETHLTVLFSLDKRLASSETVNESARRVFRSFDPDGNNFINSAQLQDLLRQLNLVCDKEYVDIMLKKLDSENLGIILLHAFLEEFFPEVPTPLPDTFTLYHYNGLPRSQPNRTITYQEASAILLECDMKCILDSNQILTCLQTKWPNIELTWMSGTTPSLN